MLLRGLDLAELYIVPGAVWARVIEMRPRREAVAEASGTRGRLGELPTRCFVGVPLRYSVPA